MKPGFDRRPLGAAVLLLGIGAAMLGSLPARAQAPVPLRAVPSAAPASTAPAEASADASLASALGGDERTARGAALLLGAIVLLALFVRLRRRRVPARRSPADDPARQALAPGSTPPGAPPEAAWHPLAVDRARLQGILDAASDAVLTADARQVIVDANPAAAGLFRCARAELIGAPLERFIPARFREAHRREVEAFGAGDDPARPMGRTREVRGLRADGEEFPIEAGISHLEVDGERLYTVILRDITSRQETEAALRTSKAKLEAALSSMSDAMLIADAEGRFVDFNEACLSYYRFRDREDCCRTLADYAEIFDVRWPDGTPAPLVQWAVPRALRGERASSVEYVLRRKDTGQTWIGSYSFAPIRGSDGGIVGAVVTSRDVTDIKRAQVDLQASHARLQRLIANQQRVQEEERKRIARELHDDLQQSLAAIRMDAIAVGERIADGRGDLQGLLDRIDRLSAAAIASTRRIVGDLRPELLEELGLVAALQALCAQHAQRTGSDCRFEALPGAVDARLDDSAVATGLYRIAQEALNNVAKHARATAVHVRLDCTPDHLVILRISDDGIGLVPRDKRRPESFGLLGMGERVRALGGHLRIDGEAGAGTTIEALIPLVAPADVDVPQPPLAPVAAAGPAGPADERGQSLQAVIDALAGNVAVLDGQGLILWINRGWREFGARHGDPGLQGCGPGVNYLEVCERSAATDASVAPLVQGLREVLTDQRPAFSAEYPCDTPDGERWFRMHAAATAGGLAIVTHIDLTHGAAPR